MPDAGQPNRELMRKKIAVHNSQKAFAEIETILTQQCYQTDGTIQATDLLRSLRFFVQRQIIRDLTLEPHPKAGENFEVFPG